MRQTPLALRMRPTHIDQVIGQQHLIADGKIINRMVKADRLASMILFGPPGTGKTSMAFAITKSLNIPMKILNAVTDRKKDMEIDRKSTRLNSSHVAISYAVFC